MKFVVVLTVCVLLIAGVAYASIPDSGGVIHGCYKNSTGMLKVIDSPSHSCGSGETALAWSQAGPAGATGATGATGPAGPPGANAISLWAYVSATGQLLRGSHVLSVQAFPTGDYRVTFDQDVSGCAWVATNANGAFHGTSTFQIGASDTVDVGTFTSQQNQLTDDPFSLLVVC